MKRTFLPADLRLCCLLGLAITWQVDAANWPGFRGPTASGVADSGNPPISFGPTSNLLWRTEVPQGHSSPIIWNDSVFATGANSNRLLTFCLDRREGKKRWEQAADGEGNVSLRTALTLFADMKKEEKLTQARWEELRNALREFKEDEGNQTVVVSVRTGGSGNVTRSHIAWKDTNAVPEIPSPLVYDNRLYIGPVPIEQSLAEQGWDRCGPNLHRHETARRQ